MDYEKAYNKALEIAKSMIDDLRKGEDILAVSNLESMFPELKESEDERIRKMIINHLTQERGSLSNDEAAEAISWLEKQGEKKHTWSEEDEEYMIDVIAFLEDARECRQNALDCIEWMKQLKERLS